MPRRSRIGSGGITYHVLNRGAKKSRLFETSDDYCLFEQIIVEAKQRVAISVFAYCLMPNHWHLVLRPDSDGNLSRFMHWLTMTHAARFQTLNGTEGSGAVYQARFKALPVQSDEHFLTVCRYVERNALRAGLVTNAREWQWSSLWRRERSRDSELLDRWPILPPSNWGEIVNRPESEVEVQAVRQAIAKGAPIGCTSWVTDIARLLRLDSSPRKRGRPRKKAPDPISPISR
jgi:putative transposase